MHRITGLECGHDFLGVAIDQRNFAIIAQRHGKQVAQVKLVHLFGRAVFHRHDDLPGCLHVLQAHFRRGHRRLLYVARHQIDLCFGQLAAGAEVRHAAG